MDLEDFIKLLVLFFIVFILGLIVYSLAYALTDGNENVTFKDKWIKYHNNDAKYLVSTTDGQVFEITDSLIRGRWDSSNFYSDITIGETCTINTQGFRVPFLSDYKNIISKNNCRIGGDDISNYNSSDFIHVVI